MSDLLLLPVFPFAVIPPTLVALFEATNVAVWYWVVLGGVSLLACLLGWSRWRASQREQLQEEQIRQLRQKLETQQSTLQRQQKEISAQQQKLVQTMEDAEKRSLELTSINEQLEKKARQRAEELQGAIDAIVKIDKELDQFVYKASHDLRSPIARMQGLVQVAQMEKDPSTVFDYLDKVDDIARDMDNMLSKLLAINVINIDKLHFKEIHFPELTQKVVSDAEANNMDSPVEVQVHIGEVKGFFCDPRLLEIILGNLLENALLFYRYISEEAPVASIDIAKRENYLRIIVQDNGIGINEDFIGKASSMFFKGTERSKGNGLGLYAVQKAVDKLNGSMEIESEQGDYTKVVVRVPFEQLYDQEGNMEEQENSRFWRLPLHKKNKQRQPSRSHNTSST